MASSTVPVIRNAKTGSVTVRVPKNPMKGTFDLDSKPTGRIVVSASAKKTSRAG